MAHGYMMTNKTLITPVTTNWMSTESYLTVIKHLYVYFLVTTQPLMFASPEYTVSKSCVYIKTMLSSKIEQMHHGFLWKAPQFSEVHLDVKTTLYTCCVHKNVLTFSFALTVCCPPSASYFHCKSWNIKKNRPLNNGARCFFLNVMHIL